ncbi:neuraminidase-like domain-containing protein [Microbispora sp. ZYX-F-249]|uniref:Neuraminidase-like domain-containing protein n=1 Tax=Microbispora maris TaxID=3144104 RepID=A0ABV0AVN5_9ACTN
MSRRTLDEAGPEDSDPAGVAARVEAALGRAPVNRGSAWFPAGAEDAPGHEACDGCESATGPAAYLSDLLDLLLDAFTDTVGFHSLEEIEQRFARPFGDLVIGCPDAVVPQVEIAVEVLERLVTRPPFPGYDRATIYGFFDTADQRGRWLYPFPHVLSDLLDAYLAELGISRADLDKAITKAYPLPGDSPADLAPLGALLGPLHLTEPEFKAGLGIVNRNWRPGLAAVDWLERQVAALATYGLDPADPERAAGFREAAERASAAVRRVRGFLFPAVRANLIRYALRHLEAHPDPTLPVADADQLGDFLHIDLSADPCVSTTRVRDAIESLQSFLMAFQLGRENPLLTNMLGDDFAERSRWLRGYEQWHAAQSVFLYPESFLLPGLRPSAGGPFGEFLSTVSTAAVTSESVRAAAHAYRDATAPLLAGPPARFLLDHPLDQPQGFALEDFRSFQAAQYTAVAEPVRAVLDEWYFWLPLAGARALAEAGWHEDAAAWLHTVFYPYAGAFASVPGRNVPRLVWVGLTEPGDESRRTEEWLRDPFSPFAVAATRDGAYLRHAVYQYVENLLAWADAEFAQDTGESVSRARELYELAGDVLAAGELPPEDARERAWRALESEILAAFAAPELRRLRPVLAGLRADGVVPEPPDFDDLRDALHRDVPFESAYADVLAVSRRILARARPSRTLSQARAESAAPIARVSGAAELAVAAARRLGFGFCVPPNPAASALRWRALSNLDKIRTGRNIAGVRRELSEDVLPTAPPPLYRFSHLIERARYYVSVAQQLQAQLLASFERGDEARYTMLKAKQDLQAAQAALRLRALQLQTAVRERELAVRQRDKAADQQFYYAALLNAGWNLFEQRQVYYEHSATSGYDTAAAFAWADWLSLNASSPFSQRAASDAAIATEYGTVAAYERREQEWRQARRQAEYDHRLAAEGILVAGDNLGVADQQYRIGRLEEQFATQGLNFLNEKFTGRELYDWMARVLAGSYRQHLDHATALARMAQRALEFERQESITIIAPFYGNRGKRDLLSAERLLGDITRLDQHRLTTEQRRQELTKTISLARSAPIEFESLRRDGVITFATPMAWFDRDFPGHYLRLVKSVSLTVAALTSPVEGIRATLSNTGVSRVMTGPPFTEPRTVHRFPESISVSVPVSGTGLFELRLDDPMLLPFEGGGVDTAWTLELSRTFDFDTLSDVFLTIRYTALADAGYRRQVVAGMGSTAETTLVSLRHRQPDAWYHFHNPVFGGDERPYELRFEVGTEDFPPALDLTGLRRLTVDFAHTAAVTAPVELEFAPYGEQVAYLADADYKSQLAGSPAPAGHGPLPFGAFTHRRDAGGAVTEQRTALGDLRPFGWWMIRLKNGGAKLSGKPILPADYPGLFLDAQPVPGQYLLETGPLRNVTLAFSYDASLRHTFS